MRKIKFKAWHIERKQMYWFDLMWGNCGRGGGYIGMVEVGKERESETKHDGNQELIDPYGCEILQYTGLKDKNGKEIYEGDIVRIEWDGEDLHEAEDRVEIYDVVFKNGCFYVGFIPLNVHADDNGSSEIDGIPTCEIIGNIYENPELISKG